MQNKVKNKRGKIVINYLITHWEAIGKKFGVEGLIAIPNFHST